MDFTGIYEKERFYRGVHVHWIDCRDIQGTNCYCDEEGEQALRRKIAPYSAEAIHFIDSGNYHYMTKLWTEKLREPFVLAVADHHPDMQPPLFRNCCPAAVGSMGCWRKILMYRRWCCWGLTRNWWQLCRSLTAAVWWLTMKARLQKATVGKAVSPRICLSICPLIRISFHLLRYIPIGSRVH